MAFSAVGEFSELLGSGTLVRFKMYLEKKNLLPHSPKRLGPTTSSQISCKENKRWWTMTSYSVWSHLGIEQTKRLVIDAMSTSGY